MLRRHAKTTESRRSAAPGTFAREIPARPSTFQTLRMIDTSVIRERFKAVGRGLSERSRRLLAAAEAKTAGHGGITAVALATGVARSTVGRGLKDLADPDSLSGEVRRPGGGCPTLIERDPTLLDDLRQLVEPATMGDPMRPMMRVSKSRAKLAAALREMGHEITANSVPKLLEALKYRRQVNRKTLEGSHNPDRNAQFEHKRDGDRHPGGRSAGDFDRYEEEGTDRCL